MDDVGEVNMSGKVQLQDSSDARLVAGLEDVLKKQLKLMRSARDNKAVELAEQTSEFVNIIGQKEILKDDKFAVQRENIKRLFKELTLATAERKKTVSSELNRIRKGKRSIGAYKPEITSRHSNLL